MFLLSSLKSSKTITLTGPLKQLLSYFTWFHLKSQSKCSNPWKTCNVLDATLFKNLLLLLVALLTLEWLPMSSSLTYWFNIYMTIRGRSIRNRHQWQALFSSNGTLPIPPTTTLLSSPFRSLHYKSFYCLPILNNNKPWVIFSSFKNHGISFYIACRVPSVSRALYREFLCTADYWFLWQVMP